MKKIILISVIFTFFGFFAKAQNLNLYLKNGTTNQYSISEIRKQTFSSTEMFITKTDGTILTFNLSDIRKYTFGLTTDVAEVKVEKTNNVLIYPNPSNGFLNVNFDVSEKGNVDVSIFSIDGKLIENILSEQKEKGNYSIVWQNESIPTGTYFVKIQNNNNTTSKKLIINK